MPALSLEGMGIDEGIDEECGRVTGQQGDGGTPQ